MISSILLLPEIRKLNHGSFLKYKYATLYINDSKSSLFDCYIPLCAVRLAYLGVPMNPLIFLAWDVFKESYNFLDIPKSIKTYSPFEFIIMFWGLISWWIMLELWRTDNDCNSFANNVAISSVEKVLSTKELRSFSSS